jgi:hypothetical protein
MAPITVRPTRADLSIANAISAHTGPGVERTAEIFTWGADEHILCVLAAGWWLYCRRRTEGERRASDHVLLTTLVASALPHLLKRVFDQERPDRRTIEGHWRGVPPIGQAARRISIRACRAYRGFGFRGEHPSGKATECRVERRRGHGADADRSPGTLGERCGCRPCRRRNHRAAAEICNRLQWPNLKYAVACFAADGID